AIPSGHLQRIRPRERLRRSTPCPTIPAHDCSEDGMHRQVGRVIDQQASWAKPLGERAQEVLGELFAGTRPLKDLLNGTWLGHPVHPMVTDVPVGAMTVAAVLDVAGQDTAADLAVLTGLASMAA